MSGPPFPEEAPYGYTLAGKPRKSPGGRRPGTKNSAPPNKSDAPAPAKKSAPRAAAAPKRKANYTPILETAFEMSLMLTRYRLPEPVKMDLTVVYLERKSLAEAANNGVHAAIKRWPVLAPWVDKLTAFTPGAMLGAAAAKPFAQMLHNHGLLPQPLIGVFGLDSPEQLGARLRAEYMRRMKEQGIDPDQFQRAAEERQAQAQEPAPAWTASSAAG